MHVLTIVLLIVASAGARLHDDDRRSTSRIVERLEPERLELAVARARIDVGSLINRTEARLVAEFADTPFRRSTLAWHALADGEARAQRTAAAALVAARVDCSKTTNESTIVIDNELLCASTNSRLECVAGKYAAASGHCNNVESPTRGAAFEPLVRLSPSAFADGVGESRRSLHDNSPLPSARIVSRTMIDSSPRQPNVDFYTLALVEWSALMLHDQTRVGAHCLVDGNKTMPLPCCGAEHDECMPIMTDRNDDTYADREYCLPYARSVIAGCTIGARRVANLATSFIDGSTIYGSTYDETRHLREHRDGRLRSARDENNRVGELPPPALIGLSSVCSVLSTDNSTCFDLASPFASLLPTSAAMHIVLLREHNRLAAVLADLNAHWNDERLFQEARRILIAQLQHIAEAEWLPLIVGHELAARYSLRATDDSTAYNMDVDASSLDEYATAAGWFFVSALPDTIRVLSANDWSTTSNKHLSSLFGDMSMLHKPNGVTSLVRTIVETPIASLGLHASGGLTERFLRDRRYDDDDETADRPPAGLDLIALLVQRGRDHGLGSWTSVRSALGLPTIVTSEDGSWDDLDKTQLCDDVDIESFRRVYASPHDVDLLIGGLAERPTRGAIVGPTFAHIIARQISNVKRGDRFWWSNGDLGTNGFTRAQTDELRKSTLAAMLCADAPTIGIVQPRVFELPDSRTNYPVVCNSSAIAHLDLSAWRDVEPPLQLPINAATVEKALRVGAELYRRFRQAERQRLAAHLAFHGNATGAVVAHARYAAPKPEAVDRANVAGVLREATSVLLREGENENATLAASERLPTSLDIETLHRLLPTIDVGRVIGYYEDYIEEEKNARAECLPRPLPCDQTSRFRTASGWCNNLHEPTRGAAFEPLRRLAPPAYDDGFDTPRARAVSGAMLPSARLVSLRVHNDDQHEDNQFSHMVMQFGQLLDHDITHSPLSRGPNNAILNCSTCDTPTTLSPHCFPIPVPEEDPYFPPRHVDGTPRCIPMARSLYGQLTLGYRNQLNQLTSFIDLSHVYGSTDCETRALRLHRGGLLNSTDLGAFNREALPQGSQERLCHTNTYHHCFNAGDERNNIQPGLATVHTLQLRAHNAHARALAVLNPHWNDDRIFQEARRILIAQFQHITYAEYLPVVLGVERMAIDKLRPQRSGYAHDFYNKTCDPQMAQEFLTAAFRYGHTLIRNVFPRMDQTFNVSAFAPVQLRENFNNATALYTPQHVMGLLGTPEMPFSRHVAGAVRHHLFQYENGPYTGLDLIAVNIQRGRDHGLASYNSYRQMAGLRYARSFDDLADTTDATAIAALRSVYEHVDDIDLFSGMMSERPIKGALVGPMVAYFVAEQFGRLKRCDRFFYETDDAYLRFSPDQLAEIRKSTFAQMLCANSEYAKRVQPHAFLVPDDRANAPIPCSDLPTIDLRAWVDSDLCTTTRNFTIPRGETKRVSPCVMCTCTLDDLECHSMTVVDCDELVKEFSIDDIKKDTICLIQCSSYLRNITA